MLHPGVGKHGSGDHNQPARFLADPFLDHLQLRRLQLPPIRIESDDRVVLRKRLHRAGKLVENFIGVLRHAIFSRLQQNIDRDFAALGQFAAPQQVAQELILARRPAGKQQHPVLAIHNIDVDLALVIGGIFVFGDRFHARVERGLLIEDGPFVQRGHDLLAGRRLLQ